MSHKSKGLTLIEVIIVIAIMSVLTSSLYVVFKSGVDAWSRSDARLGIFQNGRVALDQLSRELPGAFVDGDTDADFLGTDGSAGAPDELVFMTNFAGSVYKIRYWLDKSGSPPQNILMREYIVNPADYTSTTYDDSIKFAGAGDEVGVNDIQFKYLSVIDIPIPADWDSEVRNEWSSVAESDTLPEAVKVMLELVDRENKTYSFETIIYLPNSTAN